jgi:hypothetical protein
MPYNPDSEWIECDGCKGWFHVNCVYRDLQKNNTDFLCENCTKKEAEKKKKKKK